MARLRLFGLLVLLILNIVFAQIALDALLADCVWNGDARERVAERLLGGHPLTHEFDGEKGTASLAVLLAGIKSAREGRRVEVKEVLG